MISGWQLLVILVIVILLFGTKKIRNIGTDLGGAIKSFRSAVKDQDKDKDKEDNEEAPQLNKKEGDVIEGEVEEKQKKNV